MIRRGFALPLGLALAAGASAQVPDVIVKIDLLLNYRTEQGGRTFLRAYDSLGRYGTAGLSFTLEPGFQVLISQRLQKIRGNADDDQLDELYIEDRGYWKVGKQVMPFGKNSLLRESIYGARLETTLGTDALPASLAACDGGSGLQRGFIGRIGSRLGVSFAIGDHFGIDASSLTVIRRPEDSPGRHRGYKQIIGVDYSRKVGRLDLRIEHAWFRNGQTPLDESKEVTDVILALEPVPDKAIAVGWSKDSDETGSHFRIVGKWPVATTAWIEPILKMTDGEVKSFGVSVRSRF